MLHASNPPKPLALKINCPTDLWRKRRLVFFPPSQPSQLFCPSILCAIKHEPLWSVFSLSCPWGSKLAVSEGMSLHSRLVSATLIPQRKQIPGHPRQPALFWRRWDGKAIGWHGGLKPCGELEQMREDAFTDTNWLCQCCKIREKTKNRQHNQPTFTWALQLSVCTVDQRDSSQRRNSSFQNFDKLFY